jgi:predicted dehydrogenase
VRFYPLCHEAAARVRSGFIGDVLHVRGSYVQDWLLFPSDFNWRVLSEEGGELRAVADIGTHWLDLVQFITGRKIISVCADLQTVHAVRQRPTGGAETFSGMAGQSAETHAVKIATDDGGSVMFRLAGGAQGVLWVSQTTAGRRNSLQFEIGGSRSALAWDSEQPNSLWIGHRDRPNEQLLRDPALLSDVAAPLARLPGGHNEGFPDTFRQLFESFYGCLESGVSGVSSPYPTFADGHQEILLCEAILRSHQQRCWIDLQETAQ